MMSSLAMGMDTEEADNDRSLTASSVVSSALVGDGDSAGATRKHKKRQSRKCLNDQPEIHPQDYLPPGVMPFNFVQFSANPEDDNDVQESQDKAHESPLMDALPQDQTKDT